MDDNGKYLRLFGTIFFTFIGFIIACVLLMLCMRVFFGVLSYIPGVTNFFTLFIISVPAALFISVFIIFWMRTRSHPSQPVRWVSYILFAAALLLWIYVFIADLINFFKHYSAVAGNYMSYDMIFLIANVVVIFFIGIMQALAMPDEKGWMERGKQE